MKYLSIFILILFVSCVKEETVVTPEPPKPVMIKVDAEHDNGLIISTPIVLVR